MRNGLCHVAVAGRQAAHGGRDDDKSQISFAFALTVYRLWTTEDYQYYYYYVYSIVDRRD